MTTRRDALLLGLAAAAAPAAALARGAWGPREPIPWPVQEVYGTAWRGQVVIAGGMAPGATGLRGGVNPQDRTGVYDPRANRWREGPRLPFPRHHPVLAAVGDRIYAIGGYRVTEAGAWVGVTDVLSWDGGEAWTSAPSLPQLQCETVALTLGDRIHVVSGRAPKGAANLAWSDQGDIDLHQVFDAKVGKWTKAAPCPQARNSAAGGVIGGKLYLVGGRRVGEGNSGRLDRYDPSTDKWETLAAMPRGAGGLAAAVMDGRLYTFGGEGGPGVISDCWSYDPTTDKWSAEAPMRTPRHGLAAATVGGRIYAVGGGIKESGGQVSDVVEVMGRS